MFSDIEQAAMRNAQEGHMMDRCLIFPFERWERDSRGTEKKIFGHTCEAICGLKMSLDQKEPKRSRYQEIEADAELRLPLAIAIKPLDEIEITHRFGAAQMELHRYEVVKFENRGVSGQRVLLKAVYV